MFSLNYIFLLNITYIFAIITCLGFLVLVPWCGTNLGVDCWMKLMGVPGEVDVVHRDEKRGRILKFQEQELLVTLKCFAEKDGITEV